MLASWLPYLRNDCANWLEYNRLLDLRRDDETPVRPMLRYLQRTRRNPFISQRLRPGWDYRRGWK